jgi:hypothetical protein
MAESKHTTRLAYPDHRPSYRSWYSMIDRCTNPSKKGWENYGGRGIAVCERWRKFANFLSDMGDRPNGLSLDRIDNDKNYEPGNCRWATRGEQARNRRSNRLLTYKGETHVMKDWATILGIKYITLRYRLFVLGWTVEKALETPVHSLQIYG